MTTETVISGAVEGPVDEAVLRRLIHVIGATPGPIYGKRGKDRLVQQVTAYSHAARLAPWVVLMDLDRDADCAPILRNRLLPDLAPALCFRIAVRAIEAWLLADRERFAEYFGIVLSKVPPQPEVLTDPKRAVVDLARSSRRKEIRHDLVPRQESGRTVGPAYTSHLLAYIQEGPNGWRPSIAAEGAQSLKRALRCLERLLQRSA
jgi:hypothetical protein